ncbi:peptidoglycan-binding protein [Sorangium sp. So ce448]|uniref:peptidoglycan-binding protein n=1 Tax=Sorangium sp. So ce448 TaxID=3133314 RepID=UPI003F5E0593
MTEWLDDDPEGFATQDALVSTQGPRVRLPFYVAPATDTRFNTVRPSIAPIACWRLNEALFDLDSSLLKPGVRASAPRFAALLRANEGSLAAVFGHADASGLDDYNRGLSVRRAQALYGLLTRDVALWEKLYEEPLGNDRWGTRAVQMMLGALLDPAADPERPYYAGDPSGIEDGPTIAAVRRFQADRGLTTDGDAGPKTRAELFAAYMDAVCTDAAGQPFSMTLDRFVGRGEDPLGKGAHQGCSEFNPVLVISQADQRKYDSGAAPRAERDARNASNRRAMVFLFPGDIPVTASAWPCPRADEGSAACRKMFWPDGDQRRRPDLEAREYRNDHRTMACTWYDRFARFSPCEGRTYTQITITLRNRWAELIAGAPYRIQAAGRSRVGRAPDGVATITVPGVPERCLVEWGRTEDRGMDEMEGPPPFRLELYVNYDIGTIEEQARKRLHNIGYPDTDPLDAAVRAFQWDIGLSATGTLDESTHLALVAAHGTLATPVVSLDEADRG